MALILPKTFPSPTASGNHNHTVHTGSGGVYTHLALLEQCLHVSPPSNPCQNDRGHCQGPTIVETPRSATPTLGIGGSTPGSRNPQ